MAHDIPAEHMYVGHQDKPCCLCGAQETTTLIEVPPRTIRLMKNSGSIAWQDVVGPVKLQFCADDWETVRGLVLEMDMSPLSRCNVAHASLDLKEDHEALLNATREQPDQTELEERLTESARATLADIDEPNTEDRDVVEARILTLALTTLGVIDPSSPP